MAFLDTIRQKEVLLKQLDPEMTMRRRLRSRLKLNGGLIRNISNDDTPRGADIIADPQFAQPMYEAVRELMPELLLAGADKLPDDCVTVLETNPQFTESFMVGLNHEMARELLWRGLPTDLQGSYFNYFWGATAADNGLRPPELPPLHTWDTLRRLGDHLVNGNTAGQLALVVRGELLRRFPEAVI